MHLLMPIALLSTLDSFILHTSPLQPAAFSSFPSVPSGFLVNLQEPCVRDAQRGAAPLPAHMRAQARVRPGAGRGRGSAGAGGLRELRGGGRRATVLERRTLGLEGVEDV